MKKVFKYTFANPWVNTFEIPKNAEILCVQSIGEVTQMWCKVDVNEPTEKRTFVTIGTGHEFDDSDKTYIGTTQEDIYVWHIFEITGANEK